MLMCLCDGSSFFVPVSFSGEAVVCAWSVELQSIGYCHLVFILQEHLSLPHRGVCVFVHASVCV